MLIKRTLIATIFTIGFGLVSLLVYSELALVSVSPIKDMTLESPLKVFTADGKLIAEYGHKRRSLINIDEIPPRLIQAFIATEDQRFYEHNGVDFIGLSRAAINMIKTRSKRQGGGTITMQVARNYFLTRERTFIRKFNEILLAWKIERLLSKDEIMLLYVNKIFFGKRAYGIAAAAQVYYGKSVDELTLSEIAMLAGLPKAPSVLNPLNNPERALARRNHVLARMYDVGFIEQSDYLDAKNAPLTASYHGTPVEVSAPYVAEMVRKQLNNIYDAKDLYTKGYHVYTTIDSKAQNIANRALEKGIMQYDKRHGYRGPVSHFKQIAWFKSEPQKLVMLLNSLKTTKLPAHYHIGIITKLEAKEATVVLTDEKEYILPWKGMSWAARYVNDFATSQKPKQASDILREGDIIYVNKTQLPRTLSLTQLPAINGAFVAANAFNGAIVALVGGYNFNQSKFNRVTQAKRQPGSNFKPFIYSAALKHGMTAASIINDAPVVFNNTAGIESWRPENYSGQFYGPTRLRKALIKSRNLVSIRLLQKIGIQQALEHIKHFGFETDTLPHDLSLALGSGEVTPLKLVEGYATFVNSGHKITPFLINAIKDEKNNLLFAANPATVCFSCDSNTIKHAANQIITEENAYITRSMLQDVIKEGTGRRAQIDGRDDIGGKTGTTNDQTDAWFTGFGHRYVASAWIGFDKPRSLGYQETGGRAALPVWHHFMKNYLTDKPPLNIKQPDSIIMVRIDPESGLIASPNQKDSIFELFTKDSAPKEFKQLSTTTPSQTTTVEKNNTPDAELIF